MAVVHFATWFISQPATLPHHKRHTPPPHSETESAQARQHSHIKRTANQTIKLRVVVHSPNWLLFPHVDCRIVRGKYMHLCNRTVLWCGLSRCLDETKFILTNYLYSKYSKICCLGRQIGHPDLRYPAREPGPPVILQLKDRFLNLINSFLPQPIISTLRN